MPHHEPPTGEGTVPLAAEPSPEARIATLEAQLLEMRRARDEALRALAEEKAKLSAHLLDCPRRSLPTAEAAARFAGASAPLRYRVADAVNDGIKRLLPGVHRGLKRRAAPHGNTP